MKLRYKILYMSFGAGLVVLGMVLNSLVSGDAEAQGGVKDATFRNVYCESLIIKDGDKRRGYFGLSPNRTPSAGLAIFGEGEHNTVAYLGADPISNEMKLSLRSKSKTDKRKVSMSIDENGGRFDSNNKMGENVVRIAVGSDGGGHLDKIDKFGYVK